MPQRNTNISYALSNYYRIQEVLGLLEKGKNVLVNASGSYFLMKYDGFELEMEPCNYHRHNRNVIIQTCNELSGKEQNRHKLNIFGTHCLKFSYDAEFDLWLPSSSGSDIFITVARETGEGRVIPEVVKIITDEDLICGTMNRIVRPNYFLNVIKPFLEGETTNFCPPKPSDKNSIAKARREYLKVVCEINNHSFIYVGSKEEVYLLTVVKDSNGYPRTQGTYTASAKPLFYFSNNYLGFISCYDAEKPKFDGSGACNVAKYRTVDISGFKGKPFIFPQMDRSQNCKNSLFTVRPEIITGKIDEALEHFSATDFREYVDVVRRYAKLAGSIHLSSEKRQEYYF